MYKRIFLYGVKAIKVVAVFLIFAPTTNKPVLASTAGCNLRICSKINYVNNKTSSRIISYPTKHLTKICRKVFSKSIDTLG
jgi:hypothetical protein